MKLARIGSPGFELPIALLNDSTFVDLADLTDDIGEDFFATGRLDSVPEFVALQVSKGNVDDLPRVVRFGPPIARPHQIICIGLNYTDHARESGMALPDEPIIFTKSPNTMVGPNDDVHIPRESSTTDWEVELGVVVGTRARYLSTLDEATRCIAGYVLVNDVSDRHAQLERGGQWSKGKSAETFNPCGPWLLTRDEVSDAGSIDLWLTVNGEFRQRGSTSDMVFGPAEVVRYLSQFMVLEPGDLINTGTPAGVGLGMNPPTYLRATDVIELGGTGLGQQRQTCVPAP